MLSRRCPQFLRLLAPTKKPMTSWAWSCAGTGPALGGTHLPPPATTPSNPGSGARRRKHFVRRAPSFSCAVGGDSISGGRVRSVLRRELEPTSRPADRLSGAEVTPLLGPNTVSLMVTMKIYEVFLFGSVSVFSYLLNQSQEECCTFFVNLIQYTLHVCEVALFLCVFLIFIIPI